MTNEKMLEKLEVILMGCNGDTMDYKAIVELTNELKEDIRHESNVKKGFGKRDTILKRELKEVSSKPMFAEFCHPYKNLYGFVNGYMAVCLNDSLGYPKFEDTELNKSFNFESVEPKCLDSDIEIELDLNDLNSFLKIAKAKKKATKSDHLKPYTIDYIRTEGQNEKLETIGLNPQFLLDFCQLLGVDTINIQGPLSPLYAYNGEEWGILMPLRP